MSGAARILRSTTAAACLLTAPLVAAEPWLIVISGVGGDTAHRQTFVERSLALLDAAVERYGVDPAHTVYLAERLEYAPDRIAARSTRDEVEALFRRLAAEAKDDADVVIVLIGHGSAQDGGRFNMPGPDMGPSDFAVLLDLLAPRRIAFVNTTSASGAFLPVLAAPGRTVVTATRNDRELDEPLFGQFFVEAFTDGGADTDKDERLSVLEAFVYANREVARRYEDGGAIRTEHALLDDDGDGTGSDAPGPDAADGSLARTIVVGRPLPAAAFAGGGGGDDPEMQPLLEERATLAADLESLRSRRDEYEEDDYFVRLEAIVARIAEIDAELRARAGSMP